MATSGFHPAGDATPVDAIAPRWEAEEALRELFVWTVILAPKIRARKRVREL
jgi:hypothetical protein